MNSDSEDFKRAYWFFMRRWLQDQNLMPLNDRFQETVEPVAKKQQPLTPASTALGTLLAFTREVESATDLAQVQELARDVRAALAKMERVELETGKDLVENRVINRVVATLIYTSIKKGESENW